MNCADPKLFAIDCNHEPSFATVISMFAEIDTLPRAKIELSVCDRYRYRVAEDGAFDVGGHVIRPFKRMLKQGCVFGNHPVEVRFEIATHRRIGILVKGKAGTGVLDKDVGDTLLNGF